MLNLPQSTKCRVDWPDEVRCHPQVIRGYLKLSDGGNKVIFYICSNSSKELPTGHLYSMAPVFSSSGHVCCSTHLENLSMRKWNEKRDAKLKA